MVGDSLIKTNIIALLGKKNLVELLGVMISIIYTNSEDKSTYHI